MPMYEYRCPSCRNVFELLRPMARASEPAECPRGHAGAERIVSLVAARTQGSADEQFQPGGGCACSGGGACGCGG